MSKFYPIIRLERSDGKVRHVLREAGGEDSRDYFDVRCAVVWRPLFCIILGEEAYDKHYFDQQAPGILRLLDEYQEPGLSINSFLDRLSDSMILHGALAAYGETGDKDKAFVDAWWAYCDKRRLRLDLLQAPFADNFNLLSAKVQDSINSGLLRLERTSDTAQDLQGFATADLQDAPDSKFFKLKALGFAVSSFEKFPSRRPILTLGREFYGGGHNNWMR